MPGQPQNGNTAHNEGCKCIPRPVPTNQKLNRQLSNELLIGRTRTQHPPPPPDTDRATTPKQCRHLRAKMWCLMSFDMMWNGKYENLFV